MNISVSKLSRKEISEVYGMTTWGVLYWERKGVLKPMVKRNASDKTFYSIEDIDRLNDELPGRRGKTRAQVVKEVRALRMQQLED